MKPIAIALLCLTTLALIGYPFLFIANIMSFAAHPSAVEAPGIVTTAMNGFLWGSTLYPAPCVIAAIVTIVMLAKGKPGTALIWQGSVVLYLLAATACFLIWLSFG